jgi:glucose-6-phosphate isomerase
MDNYYTHKDIKAMTQSEIKFHYKNVMADVIGDEHGITPGQLKDLAEKTSPLILQLNKERQGGETPYRDLPYNSRIAQEVGELVKELRGRCENLVVFGIGGSALGNIAVHTALNSYMHNIDENQRTGPRLFVFDNIDPPQIVSFLDWLGDKLDKTIFNAISRSGWTAETAAQFMIVRQLLLDKLGPDDCKKQIITTTDANQGILPTMRVLKAL